MRPAGILYVLTILAMSVPGTMVLAIDDGVVNRELIDEIAEIRERLQLSLVDDLPVGEAGELGGAANSYPSDSACNSFRQSLDRVIRRHRADQDRRTWLGGWLPTQAYQRGRLVGSVFLSAEDKATVGSLRDAARRLDDRAADAEDGDKFADADRLRALAGELRQEARSIVRQSIDPIPPNTANRSTQPRF